MIPVHSTDSQSGISSSEWSCQDMPPLEVYDIQTDVNSLAAGILNCQVNNSDEIVQLQEVENREEKKYPKQLCESSYSVDNSPTPEVNSCGYSTNSGSEVYDTLQPSQHDPSSKDIIQERDPGLHVVPPLVPHHDCQPNSLAAVHPIGGFGRGRLKHSFQQLKRTQASVVGDPQSLAPYERCKPGRSLQEWEATDRQDSTNDHGLAPPLMPHQECQPESRTTVHPCGGFGRGQLKHSFQQLKRIQPSGVGDPQILAPHERCEPSRSLESTYKQDTANDHGLAPPLMPHQEQQSNSLATVHPSGGFGRGQLKHTFQQLKRTQALSVGDPQSPAPHERCEPSRSLLEDEATDVQNTAGVSTCASSRSSSEKSFPSFEPHLTSSVESKTPGAGGDSSSDHDTNETEQCVVKQRPDAPAQSNWFLFHLLGAIHGAHGSEKQSSRQDNPSAVLEKTTEKSIASLQRSIERLEVGR